MSSILISTVDVLCGAALIVAYGMAIAALCDTGRYKSAAAVFGLPIIIWCVLRFTVLKQ